MKILFIILALCILGVTILAIFQQTRCLKGHFETQMVMDTALFVTTKVPIFHQQEVWVCDIYENKK